LKTLIYHFLAQQLLLCTCLFCCTIVHLHCTPLVENVIKFLSQMHWPLSSLVGFFYRL